MSKYLIIAIFFLSCRTTKNVDKVNLVRNQSIDSTAKIDSGSTKVSLDEKIKENENSIEFFTPYDFIVDTSGEGIWTLDPKLLKHDTMYMPSIKVNPDGSFEATGVKKVNLKSIEWQKKYDSLNNEYNLEINKRLVLEDQLKTKVVEKEKRPVAVAWLLFLVIGFITGFYAKYKLK